MTGKRLAILGSRGIPARYGGFETFAEEVSWRLVDAGVDVTVFCEDSGPSEYRGIALEYVPTSNLGPFSTILFDLRSLWRARRGYDVVYMLGYGAACFCFLPRLWGAEVWINMDGIEWQRSKWSGPAKLWFKAMEWIATRTANRLIVDAEGIGEHMRTRHRRLPPTTMIPYGVEARAVGSLEERLEEYGLQKDRYCLVVCRIEPENHVLEILRGYAAIDTEVPLIVVGGLRDGDEYCDRLRSLASDKIRFLGGVYDQERLWALRLGCRAYLHGHSVGGTNPSLLEAMAAGNAVIAHDNVFNREVLGAAGWFFAGPEDLAERAADVLALPEEEHANVADRVRKRVAQEYSWDSVCQRYLELL